MDKIPPYHEKRFVQYEAYDFGHKIDKTAMGREVVSMNAAGVVVHHEEDGAERRLIPWHRVWSVSYHPKDLNFLRHLQGEPQGTFL